jgi:CheY-like chemotaxis protein
VAARRERLAAGAKGLAAGDYLCVSVSDTGCGMDEATLKRAAEPFFTTKGVGKGTGLGLSMVYGLAAQSGGGTRISSRPGTGTTVDLFFPVIEGGEAVAAGTAQHAPNADCKPCLVLVVDDDSMVAESTAAMLSDLGHSVMIACSGSAALERIRADTTIELVITDHAMPGMTGVELAKHIRQERPELPIILATGYADLPGGDDLGLPRLAKPYRQAELEGLVAKLQAPKSEVNVIPIASGRRA